MRNLRDGFDVGESRLVLSCHCDLRGSGDIWIWVPGLAEVFTFFSQMIYNMASYQGTGEVRHTLVGLRYITREHQADSFVPVPSDVAELFVKYLPPMQPRPLVAFLVVHRTDGRTLIFEHLQQ